MRTRPFASTVAAALLAAATAWAYSARAKGKADCCAEGRECCPAGPCCPTAKGTDAAAECCDCCPAGACYPGCCDCCSTEPCCVLGLPCCDPEAPCCTAPAAAKESGRADAKGRAAPPKTKGGGGCCNDRCCAEFLPGPAKTQHRPSEGGYVWPLTGEELPCPKCCPLNQTK